MNKNIEIQMETLKEQFYRFNIRCRVSSRYYCRLRLITIINSYFKLTI